MSDTDILWLMTFPCAVWYFSTLWRFRRTINHNLKQQAIALSPYSIPISLTLMRCFL